jgi:hypothetical protein
MTNPYFSADTLRIDFEGGYMEAPLGDLVGLLAGQPVDDVVLVDDTGAQLAGVAVEERIVRQSSGTAWWVDADGRRHWIPDGETWQCLGGDAVVVADDLPGFTVATLPLAEQATCP